VTAPARPAVLGYGGYLPAWRVQVKGARGPQRIAASFDEDAVTMAVEAVRRSGAGVPVDALVLATTSPPYFDKTNASAIHAALNLPRAVRAEDRIGTARSTMSVLASRDPASTLLVAADVRVGRPGSSDERGGADAAAAVLLGAATENAPALAEILATASVTAEALERWRTPDSPFASTWEERFGYEHYLPMIDEVAHRALSEAGLTQPDRVVITSPNSAVRKRAGARIPAGVETSGSPVGFAGAADPLLGLAHALDRAEPGETVLVISAADGADAVVLRTTGALPGRRPETSLAAQLGSELEVPYTTYLSWRGLLEFEPPRRPEPDRVAGPPAARSADWKFGLRGSRCTACRFVNLPPVRVCRSCGAVDAMEPVPVSELTGTTATYTVDRLAYSPSPPVVDVVVDFPEGGRATFEVADARPDDLAVGAPLEMVFRRLVTAQGVHNYFWKARQTAAPAVEEER